MLQTECQSIAFVKGRGYKKTDSLKILKIIRRQRCSLLLTKNSEYKTSKSLTLGHKTNIFDNVRYRVNMEFINSGLVLVPPYNFKKCVFLKILLKHIK